MVHKEPIEVYIVANRVHFTIYPPTYHPGITGVSSKYQPSITQILQRKSGHSESYKIIRFPIKYEFFFQIP
jgi:hypothetical protein